MTTDGMDKDGKVIGKSVIAPDAFANASAPDGLAPEDFGDGGLPAGVLDARGAFDKGRDEAVKSELFGPADDVDDYIFAHYGVQVSEGDEWVPSDIPEAPKADILDARGRFHQLGRPVMTPLPEPQGDRALGGNVDKAVLSGEERFALSSTGLLLNHQLEGGFRNMSAEDRKSTVKWLNGGYKDDPATVEILRVYKERGASPIALAALVLNFNPANPDKHLITDIIKVMDGPSTAKPHDFSSGVS